MIARALALAGGISGAAGLSQYPEFSQQYIQRLGGQVDALTLVVEEFDRSATANGLTRAAALDQMQGTAFLTARKADMERAFERQACLSQNLTFLRLATPVERITMPHRMADTDTLRATWADFRPAVPLTVAGVIAAALGFLGGWGALRLLLWPLRWRAPRTVPKP
ncbi:DUF2937 family protein [Pseudorhodobacter aquimaris]|uniref:DUF2937 family protein n=1 Tax=Pseudorhodobacter aquimaris TaxID=687412 RepID=UPI00067DC21C|nr:DUF2937 family protein [Pseudorhodobacter aquimaris]